MKWWNANTKSFLKLFGALAVGLLAVAAVGSYFGGDCNIGHPAQAAPKEPRVIKIKEVVGTVVGGPQIATGSGLIGYVVYVKELDGMVVLHARQCPQLGHGQRVVMFQSDPLELSEWYTFIRYE